ncbi:DUF4365 domain-containing protein [Desulfonema magnum]|uniref:DUF4365 n=1 Tax=Desulfonema magnum TaxID=45655 RepID=A0A975BLD9_9BACT|nr:DUF4365 domain-containing protein [Desulfonema magnum]QTA87560.1 DUF4365 [Desulfonema magnum]
MKNSVGQRGEAIFYVLITKFYGRDKPIFRPQFLGDKWQNVDFIVELEDYSGKIKPFFFVQVKSTKSGYTKIKQRLKVKVRKKHVLSLSSYPAPTYIVGIDEVSEEGFVISANGESLSGISSIPTDNPINEKTQNILWEEVRNFWENSEFPRFCSYFSDPEWKGAKQ